MLSLRTKQTLHSKMVLTLSLIVVAVSVILLFVAVKMIINDKKAYIYESVHQQLAAGHSSFDLFFSAKKNLVKVLGAEQSTDKVLVSGALDRDHYVTWIWDEEAKRTVLYENEGRFKKFEDNENKLIVDDGFIEESLLLAKKKNYVERIYHQAGHFPRLIVFVFNPHENKLIGFEFHTASFFQKQFISQSIDVALVSEHGQTIYTNKSMDQSNLLQKSYMELIDEKKVKDSKRINEGAVEKKFFEEDYVVGYKDIEQLPGYYLISKIKLSDAYLVTKNLIFNTIAVAVFLIGFFNFLSVYIVRFITRPLENLISVTKQISQGDYQVKVGEQKIFDFQLLANSFNEMVKEIHNYQEKLMEYNRTLELKVQERTKYLKKASETIAAMVNSLSQGLLVMGRDGRCLDLRTKVCEKLFGIDPVGVPIADLVKSDNKELFQTWLDSLFEEMIPFESLVELGQKSIPCELSYKDENFKFITLEYFPMRNDESLVENIVVVASDKTNEFKASKEVESQQRYVKMVFKVLRDKSNFVHFVRLFNTSLQNFLSLIEKNGQYDSDELMRLLHSMKGAAALYYLEEVVEYLHQFESHVLLAKVDNVEVKNRLQICMDKLNQVVAPLHEITGEHGQDVAELNKEKVMDFHRRIKSVDSELAKQFKEIFFSRSANQYISNYLLLVDELSQKLGKLIKPIIVENGSLSIDGLAFRPFFDSCIHIFRNVIDHGIETPEIRELSGKDPAGQIKIDFQISNEDQSPKLIFTVEDDGAGIDPKRIREKMRTLNYSEEALRESDEEIIYHIFDANLSTANEVSDISGRGVGLYDIKKIVEDAGGKIEIKSIVGSGTLFRFILPFDS